MTDDRFAKLRIKKTGHGLLHLIHKFVDDAVELDLNALLAGGGDRAVLYLDTKTDDDGIGSAGKQHITLGDRTDGGVNDLEIDLRLGNVGEGSDDRFKGALHVGLENDLKGLLLICFKVGKKILQGSAFRRGKLLFTK